MHNAQIILKFVTCLYMAPARGFIFERELGKGNFHFAKGTSIGKIFKSMGNLRHVSRALRPRPGATEAKASGNVT